MTLKAQKRFTRWFHSLLHTAIYLVQLGPASLGPTYCRHFIPTKHIQVDD